MSKLSGSRVVTAVFGLLVSLSATFTAIESFAQEAKNTTLPVVRAAVLKYGTANWELSVMRDRGIDRQLGFELQVLEVMSPSAASIALQAGEVDVSVQDWLWVVRQQDQSKRFVFSPYSVAVGSLMVPGDSEIRSLEDLDGKTIGVAGGASDKGWQLLQVMAGASGAADTGTDFTANIIPRFGAPPLLNQLASRGDLDGVLTYWHYAARLEAEGFRRLIAVDEILARLGISQPVPMLGWVFSAETTEARPAAVSAFLEASARTKSLLATDESSWSAAKPLMRTTSAREYELLRAGYISGIPEAMTSATVADITRVAALFLGADTETFRFDPAIFWGVEP